MIAYRSRKPSRLGVATFFVDGERVERVIYREKKPMPPIMWTWQRPRISRVEALQMRLAFNEGCNQEQIKAVLSRPELSDSELGSALFGMGEYRWLRIFHPDVFFSLKQTGMKSASREYIEIKPNKPAPRVLCSVCGRRRSKQNIVHARSVDFSVWFFVNGNLSRGVACGLKCKKKADSRVKGEIEWFQKQQYWIEIAKKRLSQFRRLVRSKSQNVASQTQKTSPT